MNATELQKMSKAGLINHIMKIQMDEGKEVDYDKVEERLREKDDKILELMSKQKVDRVKDWKEWSDKMVEYIAKFTVSKYGQNENSIDLMVMTTPKVCVWQILKYCFRLWGNKGKTNDLHKICHYAQLAYTLSKGDLSKAGITNDKGD